MANRKYTLQFKGEAVRQVLDRGYSVKEVAENLGVSKHSLYKWVKATRPGPDKLRDDALIESKREVLRLQAELRRVKKNGTY